MNTHIHAKKARLPKDWHPADIKAALEKAGWSLRRLSIHHGYSQGMLKNALCRPYPNAEQIIAAAIGKRPEDIWPSRYDERRPLRGIGGAPSHRSGPYAALRNHRLNRHLSTDDQSTSRPNEGNVNRQGDDQ
ncbi:helix-turn-helix domain-containing protein [Alloalcanivorax xenomutans]|uniref:helix-turn-helix domain-containing protein n=1 Tax=Alloalcanivorax xenomutans TaxID=1094342 RepID=UPI0009E99542|nr:helix-turn-helix domain-containing protein [Alloalcanivorax xenomutans]